MGFINKNIKSSSERGFTIVELLIVIVVIGILAAITIVSFNGVTAKANTTNAKAMASSLAKKAEAYNAEKNNYPTAGTDLTSTAAQSESYGLSGVVVLTANPDATTGKTGVRLQKCGPATGATTQALVTTSNIIGIKVSYWDFGTNAVATPTINVGDVTTCPAA